MIALRPYQLEAVEAVERAEVQRPLVELPTGTGKTLTFAELIRRRGGRALVLAHRDELIEQAVAKITLVHRTAEIGVVKAERDQHRAPIVVASVQTLARARRLDRIDRDFRTVVVDEAHHSTAATYVRILEHVGSMSEGGPLTLGVTATAERADGTPLGDVWQEIVYRRHILEMIRAGYLCDLRAVRVRVEVNLDALPKSHGDFAVGALDRAMHDARAPAHAVQAYLKHAPGRKALVFTPGVDLAHEVAEMFREAGVAAEALDGTTPTEERRGILRRLHTGDTRVLANCAVLTEGFDEPSIDCVIMARPTKSRPLYRQMIGRGTRLYPTKKDCLVLDLVGNTRHGVATLAGLFDLPPEALAADGDAVEGPTVTEAVDRQRAAAAEAHGRLVAEVVDVFHRAQLGWIELDPTRYVLSVPDGRIEMFSGDPETWYAEIVRRDRSRLPIVREGLSLEFAQGVVEDYVRSAGARSLTDKNAAWRTRPASERQIKALVKWRIAPKAGMTAGEASDLITTASARRAG